MTTNKLQEILAISEAELQQAVFELEQFDESGILGAGVIRGVAAKLHQEVGIPTIQARHIITTEVLRRAAHLWAMSKSNE